MDATNSSSQKNFLDWTPGQVVRATLVVISVGIGFMILYRFRLVIFSLFEAIVFSTAISPLVIWLEKRKLPKAVGVGLIYLLVIGALAGFLFLFLPLIGEQGATILATLSGYYHQIWQMMEQSPSTLVQQIAFRMPATISLNGGPAAAPPAGNALAQVANIILYADEAARGIFAVVAVLLLTAYWTLDRERIVRTFLLLVPSERRDAYRDFYFATEVKVGAYIRGLFILCATVGILALIAYLLIGLPYALLLGITAGVLEAVPLVGPLLGAAPALLIALALDPSKVIWIVAATTVIQLTENHLLVPRIMDKAVGVNPVVSLLSIAAFSSLFGLPGALLAIPLAVLIQLLLDRIILEPSAVSQPQPKGRDYVSLLRYEAQELIQDVRKQVREKDGVMDDSSDQIEDAIEAVVNDLDSILANVEKNQAEALEA